MRLVRRLRYEVCVGSDGHSEVFVVRHLKTCERVGAFCKADAPPDRLGGPARQKPPSRGQGSGF